MEQAISEVEKKEFVCEADAVKEPQRFQKSHKNSIYMCNSTIITGENVDLMKELQHKEECFVLATNTDKSEYGVRQVRENYKTKAWLIFSFDF